MVVQNDLYFDLQKAWSAYLMYVYIRTGRRFLFLWRPLIFVHKVLSL